MRTSHEITELIIGSAMKLHRTLGSGFLESVYHKALAIELRHAGLNVDPEWPLKAYYEGEIVGEFTADLLVEKSIIVELKAVQSLVSAHEVQTVNYLTATKLEVGLPINFGAPSLQFKRKHRLPRPNPENPINPV